MSESENNNTLARKDGVGEHRRTHEAVYASPFVMKESSGIKTEYKTPKRIPFNGLLTNKLLGALPGPAFARLLPHLEPVALLPNQDLYQFGRSVDFAYFPETAVISHLYFLEDGSTTGAAIIGREGMVGLSTIFDSRPPIYWTQVTIGGSALRIETRVVKQEFARGESLQQILLNYTSVRLAQLSQRAVCNCRHTLDDRLCTWLLMIHDRTNEEQLPLTHEEIAHHLGARRAGVTTTCHHLRDNGIINYRRGMMSILDREKLEAAACECYRALRQTEEQFLNPK
jgi:CRP-like cAMP-binding protein